MSPTTATFAPQKVPTCICALCIQETEYVSHHSPFALRKVHVYMYLCTMYSGNRICQPSQPFCTEECTYMYLCTMYSGNRIYFSHNSPFTLLKVLTCICALCIQETEYVSHNSPFLFCKMSACICALCIQETEHVSNNSPLCTAKSTYMSLGTRYLPQ